MSWKTVLVVVAAGGMAAASFRAMAGGSAEAGGSDHPALGAHTEVLEIPRGATDAERLVLLRADFRGRKHRIDWKSDSVVKRVRWALRDAGRALDEGDAETASRRLDDAQALLERW